MKHLNWVQLLLGLWVLASVWVLGFEGIGIALWSNVVVGVLIIIISLWQIFGKKSFTTPSSQ
ncbi:SPW repeat protein [Candidatus Wolfebacteria bacterium]|nr:SPW repeat protein [Candidatus Wolfebacteria bacterium]